MDGKKAGSSGGGSRGSSPIRGVSNEDSKDNSFREFRAICIKLAEEPSYNAKSKILADFFEKGRSGGIIKRQGLWLHLFIITELRTGCRTLVYQHVSVSINNFQASRV